KIDLVGFDEGRCKEIEAEYGDFATTAGVKQVFCVPVSALLGDNLVERSARTPWFSGPPLLQYLEEVAVSETVENNAFRLPVQWVCRPHLNFRGYAGTVQRGTIRAGDDALVLPFGHRTRIVR